MDKDDSFEFLSNDEIRGCNEASEPWETWRIVTADHNQLWALLVKD